MLPGTAFDRRVALLSRGNVMADRALRVALRCFDVFMMIFGPVLVCAATVMIGYIVYVYFAWVMPAQTETFSLQTMVIRFLQWWLTTMVGVWFLYNVFFNYFCCVFTDPGEAPRGLPEMAIAELYRQAHGVSSAAAQSGEQEQFPTWCKLCDNVKPPRTHHCHVSNRCVLRMDHYCPWMANTVGFRNYRYFYLFLFYMWVGAIFVALVSATPFLNKFRMRSAAGRGDVTFMFVISVAVGASVMLMLAWHTYLVASNQTTIEFYMNSLARRHANTRGEVPRNIYDLGISKNWESVFGYPPSSVLWMLPRRVDPPGDGLEYPTVFQPKPTGLLHRYKEQEMAPTASTQENGSLGREGTLLRERPAEHSA